MSSRWSRTPGPTLATAVAVAVRLADELGIRCPDPDVLSDGSNVLVHLRPAPVVARVATTTSLVRPGVAAWLRRDIALASFLHDAGIPVVRPCTDPPAGPYELDGQVISLWRHVPHDRDATCEPAAAAAALAELHAAARAFPGELPEDGPFSDLRHTLELLDRCGVLTGPELAALHAVTAELDAGLAGAPVLPLHGDPHLGNLLSTPDGPVWNDFEDTWRGPLGWDLACLVRDSDRDAALAGYPGPVDEAELDLALRLRELFSVAWAHLLAQRFPRLEQKARHYLDEWLSRAG